MTKVIYGDDGDNLIEGAGEADKFFGRGGDDTLAGGAGDDELRGQGGDDRLDGGDGDDRLYGDVDVGPGQGHNTLNGGLGHDELHATAFDQANGGAGDDYLSGFGGGTGAYDGGEGRDRLVFQFASADSYHGNLGYLADEAAGATLTLDGVTVSGFEAGQLILGGGDDVVRLARDVVGWAVSGGDGADAVAGGAGADTLQGGIGDDTVRGLGGDDVLTGDFYGASGDHDLIEGGAGDDLITGGYGAGTLDGGAGSDTITGGGGGGTLIGGGGGDLLTAAYFGPAALIEGGDGADTLIGSKGGDTLQGGAGRDIYLYDSFEPESRPGAPDLIQDSDGDLRIDLSGIDADPPFPDDAFTVVKAFDGGAGELVIRYDRKADVTKVIGDIDGDRHADVLILVEGDHTDLSQYVL